MTGVRNRIGLVVVLLLILIPAVYVLADEAYIDSDRFTVNTAEIDGDIQFEDVTGCSVRMQVTNHGDDFEGTLKILRYESTDGSYVSAVGRTVHIKSGGNPGYLSQAFPILLMMGHRIISLCV